MVAIKDIELEYKDGKLVFLFQNKKNLLFNCSSKEFEKVTTHMKALNCTVKHFTVQDISQFDQIKDKKISE
jgi:hypothetical protein